MEGKKAKIHDTAIENPISIVLCPTDVFSYFVNITTNDEFDVMRCYGSSIPSVCKSWKNAWEKAIEDGKIKIDRQKMFVIFDCMFEGWRKIYTFINCATEEIGRLEGGGASLTFKFAEGHSLNLEIYFKDIVRFRQTIRGRLDFEPRYMELREEAIQEVYSLYVRFPQPRSKWTFSIRPAGGSTMQWKGEALDSRNPIAKEVFNRMRLCNSMWDLGLDPLESISD